MGPKDSMSKVVLNQFDSLPATLLGVWWLKVMCFVMSMMGEPQFLIEAIPEKQQSEDALEREVRQAERFT